MDLESNQHEFVVRCEYWMKHELWFPPLKSKKQEIEMQQETNKKETSIKLILIEKEIKEWYRPTANLDRDPLWYHAINWSWVQLHTKRKKRCRKRERKKGFVFIVLFTKKETQAFLYTMGSYTRGQLAKVYRKANACKTILLYETPYGCLLYGLQ